MYRQALAIDFKALGEGHPRTAVTLNNLAITLRERGKYGEAEAMCRQALAIRLKVLGGDHPDTAKSYKDLALTLESRSQPDAALLAGTPAAGSFQRAGLLGRRGLDSALAAVQSPLPALALARAGRPRDAWARWEASLARGLLDEVAGRALRPL